MKNRFVFVLLCLLLFISGCAKNAAPLSRTCFAFDTVISITVYDESKTYVLDNCLKMCEEYEKLFSPTIEGSDIWNINHSSTNMTPVSYSTAMLIQKALYYCNETDGILDLTMLPITDEWNISEQMTLMSEIENYEYYIPTADKLNKLLEHVDYRNVFLYDELGNELSYNDILSEDMSYSVKLSDSECAIGLGFIAKGFIADELKKYMVSENIKNGIINLGGNVLLIGSKPDNTPFNVGVQKPFASGNGIITSIEKTDKSVVSSGCYERYFESNHILYHHIFDTSTGYPVHNDLLGVTIISDTSTQGDALSTYCYILGLEKGLEYIHSLNGVEAIFITTDYDIIYS